MTSYILYSRKKEAARKEIRDVDGRITQELTRDLFLAVLPNSYDVMTLKHSHTKFPATLSKKSRLMLEAWRLTQRKSEKYISAGDPNRGLLWGTPGLETPLNQNLVRDMIAPEVLPIQPPLTSRQMTGSVAVSIIIVSGPGDLSFTELQKQKVISEIIEGLQFLATAEPRAKLIFHHDVRKINVNAIPGPTTMLESGEAPWRDQALYKMGFTSGSQGSVDYVNALRQRMQTDWAYVGFFTKYALKKSAYTIRERVVMRYVVDDRIADNMNTVFAHESCHVFGASDEYAPCSCNERHGVLRVANGNCPDCAANFVPCLMAGSIHGLCDFTRKQIGWDASLFP
jgi:hypothetical protein